MKRRLNGCTKDVRCCHLSSRRRTVLVLAQSSSASPRTHPWKRARLRCPARLETRRNTLMRFSSITVCIIIQYDSYQCPSRRKKSQKYLERRQEAESRLQPGSWWAKSVLQVLCHGVFAPALWYCNILQSSTIPWNAPPQNENRTRTRLGSWASGDRNR